ncbi:ABC transporter ATP-binding protein [Carboxylicivirga caseinilyticus]|uniref:ABC transporter ATP-binding protein n=1 Tax=Carboxylicivirga caseinilyticus TaxID=3417572 RepID=UPI003D3466DB|nr:ABC transporter ATP-binding protein [Marinilabiliaceae bacterium A049]
MILQISNLSHQFQKLTVLKNINLEITKPGLYVFAGANGSGKSTLFNCITGMLQANKGTISLNSQDIGIVYEPVSTEPNLTVLQIIKMVISIRNAKMDELDYQIKYWDLDENRNKTFKALSLGMRKRLLIACSLIGNPKIQIWDEPFNGLDPLGMNKLREVINNQIKQGNTILLSTHILGELDTLAAEIYVLKEGGLVYGFKPDKSDNNLKQQIIEVL